MGIILTATVLSAAGCGSPAQLLKKAEQAVRVGEYKKAIEYVDKVLSAEPANMEANIIKSFIKYGDNMLHAALQEDDAPALRYIAGIVENVDVEGPRFHAPAIVLAAAWGKAEMVNILLEAGADPNAGTDRDGYTALMWAAKNFDEQLELTKALLDAGADVNARSDYDETALSIAEEYENPNVASLIRSRGGKK